MGGKLTGQMGSKSCVL